MEFNNTFLHRQFGNLRPGGPGGPWGHTWARGVIGLALIGNQYILARYYKIILFLYTISKLQLERTKTGLVVIYQKLHLKKKVGLDFSRGVVFRKLQLV